MADHRCENWFRVVYHGGLAIATASHLREVDAGLLEWLHVFMGAATVEGYHKTSVVHDLEGQERAIAELVVGDELCPPAAHAHSRYAVGHSRKKP